jgi:hypothetical protein
MYVEGTLHRKNSVNVMLLANMRVTVIFLFSETKMVNDTNILCHQFCI